MALTETEYQNIVNAALSAIRTNSRTIDQLTPVTNISTKDFFEIGGGRKISFGLLRQLIISLNSEDYGPLLELVESMKDSIGEPNGLVQLDESGKIASRFLPSYVDDIVEFTEMLNGLVDPLFCEELPEEYASLPNEGTGNDIVLKWVAEASAVNVFYHPEEQRFICGRRAKIMRGDTVIKDIILTAPNKFFAEFGFDVVGGLATPLINKIYVDLSDRKWYRWSGNALVEMPKNVELGEQAGMAYPGNLGTSNRESIANLQASVTLLQEALAQLGNGGNDYKDSVGKPDGLCPLDETGHVASRYLPSYVDDIVEISGIIENNGFSVNFVVEDEYPEFYTELKNDPSQWPDVYVQDRDYLGAKSIYFVRNGAYFVCGQITELRDRETGEAVEITLVKAPDVDWTSMGFEDYGGSARPCVSKIYYNWEDENMYRWTNFSLRAFPKEISLGEVEGTAYPGNLGAENRERVDQLQQQIDSLSSSESSGVSFPRIFCESNGYELRLYGARPYLKAGYIPFLLRPTSKRNRFVVLEDGGKSIYHSDVKRGWHQMYDTHYINIDPEDGLVTFKHKRLKTSNIPHIKVCIKKRRALTGYLYDMPVISWGNNYIDLARRLSLTSDNYMDNDVKWRTIRLPFAIVFAKPDFDRDIQPVTQNHIVSNLACFSLIYAGEKPSGSLARPIFNPKLGT